MKILYITDSKKYKYHNEIIGDFLSVTGGEVLDLPIDDSREMKYFDVANAKADVIITLDCAGLDFMTVTDTLSLNNLNARMAHIMFHQPSFYGQVLNFRQNLSMFTYVPAEEDAERYRRIYEEVPNILNFCEFDYKACNEEEHLSNRANIQKWWDSFKKDAML